MRAAKAIQRNQTARRTVYRKGSWLRDRDMLGAWGFRGLSTAFLSVIVWLLLRGQGDIDELKKEVPVLSNTVAALTDQLKGEQAQISKIWDRILDEAVSAKKK